MSQLHDSAGVFAFAPHKLQRTVGDLFANRLGKDTCQVLVAESENRVKTGATANAAALYLAHRRSQKPISHSSEGKETFMFFQWNGIESQPHALAVLAGARIVTDTMITEWKTASINRI